MNNILVTISLGCLAAPAVPAQQLPPSSTLPRGEVRLSSDHIDVGVHGFSSWRIAAPKERLPAGPAGTMPTAQVAYVCYMDKDLAGRDVLAFRRTIDGGYTWQAAQTLHTTAVGEVLSGPETRLVAFGHEVYVVWASNAQNLSTTLRHGVWAMGSADQGQTWTAPALLSTGVLTNLYDVDEVNAAVSQSGAGGPGFLNVVYEADYAVPASGIEDLFFVQAQIVGNTLAITQPETRLNHAAPAVVHDVNFTDIAAQGPVIHVCWTDNRSLGGTRQYDYFSITSRANGADFATAAEYRHTQFGAPLSWDAPRRPSAAIDLPNVYTFMEHSQNGQDDVWMDWSSDLGVTWAVTGVAINTATLGSAGDVDDFDVVARDGRIAVLYVDDRLNGTNNNDNNQAIVAVSYNAGADFQNGTHVEVPLSQRDPNPIFGIDMVGDVVAALYETNCGGSEDFAVSLSSDGGRSFTHHEVSSLGACGLRANTTDVDDPRMTLTRNGDCLMTWIDDRGIQGQGLGNSFNYVYATGIKYPQLIDRTANLQGLVYRDDSPADAGDLVLVVLSGTGTAATMLDPNGFTMNLAFDFWTYAAIGGGMALPPGPPNLNLAIVSPNGDAAFPNIPNVTQLLGLPFWAAALTIDGTPAFGKFTDPIRFQ